MRLLNVNGTFQSVAYVPEGLRFQLACEYHREMARVIEGLAARGPVRVLVMGGGGYSLPKYLAAYVPAARVDVVEIDPAVTRLARERFFLDECLERTGAEKDGRLRLVNDDAWAFVRAAEEPYDVIVNDAFSGNRPLGPLTSTEGAAVVRAHLAADGVYLANVRCACEGRRARVLREVADAFGSEFGQVGLCARVAGRAREARQQRAGGHERRGRDAGRGAGGAVAGARPLSAARLFSAARKPALRGNRVVLGKTFDADGPVGEKSIKLVAHNLTKRGVPTETSPFSPRPHKTCCPQPAGFVTREAPGWTRGGRLHKTTVLLARRRAPAADEKNLGTASRVRREASAQRALAADGRQHVARHRVQGAAADDGARRAPGLLARAPRGVGVLKAREHG